MEYKYNTPEEAIISLEKAYSNQDLDKVIASKDFETEAKLILQSSAMDLTKEIVKETAELLRLSLIEHIQSNGYPNFNDAERVFSDLSEIDENLYFLEETLIYSNGEKYINKILLTRNDNQWRIVTTE
jgi:hypothetical protein